MNEKICGLLGGQIKKNMIAELHKLVAESDLRHFDVAPDALADLLKTESFDLLYVDMALRLRVMPLMSKTSPEARLGGGVDMILRLPNGKLYGHNTEIYGFSYLLDRAGLEIAGKKCLILGNGLDSAAVYNVLKARGASSTVLITRDKYANIGDHADAEIVVVTSRAEAASLEDFKKLEAVVDIRTDRLNSELAGRDGVVYVNGISMAAARVKFACECMTGVELSENELAAAVQTVTKMRTSIILFGPSLTELGQEIASRMGRKFYDINATIERLNGKSIEQIKKEHGDAELRRMKRVAVEWASKQLGAVITVDGTEDLSKLKRNGVIFSMTDGDDADKAIGDILKYFES